jgi:TNF receptor-associated factor 3
LKTSITELSRELAEMKRSLERQSADSKSSEQHLLKLVAGASERLIRIESKSNTTDIQLRELEGLKARSMELTQTVQQLQSSGGVKAGVSGEIRGQITNHDLTVQEHDKQLAEMDLRMQCMETTNFQGTLIWKINDYHRRLVEAKSGKTLSLYSQPFYTSRYGYKMCARVYLNGDGAGRNRFISFFFVIMQGDYDDILSWPFKQKVTLMLLDQRNQRKPISDTFRPDPTSSSFQKPVTAMNVASGCPQFVEHGTLENDDVYLKNEILFFKVVVDTSDLLNP